MQAEFTSHACPAYTETGKGFNQKEARMTTMIAMLILLTVRIVIPLLIILSIGEAINRRATTSQLR